MSTGITVWNWKYGLAALIMPAVVFLAIHLLFGLGWQVSLFLGLGSISLFWFVMRWTLLRHHVRGVRNFRSEAYEEALQDFHRSFISLRERPYIDRFRILLLGSSSDLDFLDMAFVNIAACHVRLGDGEKGREYFREALRENPDNALAQKALKAIENSRQSASVDTEAA